MAEAPSTTATVRSAEAAADTPVNHIHQAPPDANEISETASRAARASESATAPSRAPPFAPAGTVNEAAVSTVALPTALGRFAATITMPEPGARASPKTFYQEAIRAQNHVNTPEHIEVSMFGDGSYRDGEGAYAVAWDSVVPGSVTKRLPTVLAFHMKTCSDNQDAEIAAVAECLSRARSEVELIVKGFVDAEPGTSESTLETISKNVITINVFSDNTPNMELLRRQKWKKSAFFTRSVFQLSVDESHHLPRIPAFPGLRLRVVRKLSWVPAHKHQYFIRLHGLADWAAGEARVRRQCFRLVVGVSKMVAISPESGVLASLGYPPLERLSSLPDASRKRRAEEEDGGGEGKGPEATFPPSKKRRAEGNGNGGKHKGPTKTRKQARSARFAAAPPDQQQRNRTRTGPKQARPSTGVQTHATQHQQTWSWTGPADMPAYPSPSANSMPACSFHFASVIPDSLWPWPGTIPSWSPVRPGPSPTLPFPQAETPRSWAPVWSGPTQGMPPPQGNNPQAGRPAWGNTPPAQLASQAVATPAHPSPLGGFRHPLPSRPAPARSAHRAQPVATPSQSLTRVVPSRSSGDLRRGDAPAWQEGMRYQATDAQARSAPMGEQERGAQARPGSDSA